MEKIQLREQRITPCTGCGICDSPGSQCIQKDDMPMILEKMIRADVLVMATPVYFYSVSGQMKSFIDRTCSRYKELIGKEFYFILTAADPNQAAIEGALEPFRGFLSCLQNPMQKGVIYGVGAWEMGAVANSAAYWRALEMGRTV